MDCIVWSKDIDLVLIQRETFTLTEWCKVAVNEMALISLQDKSITKDKLSLSEDQVENGGEEDVELVTKYRLRQKNQVS